MNGCCLNCGEELKQLSTSPSIDKYECPRCCTTYIIHKWIEGEKKEGEDEEK